ncbi:MAG: HAD family phosphatase [Pseudomonadota bacterium]
MAIRNIVFDVGNVLVPWDPRGIEVRAFGEARVSAPDYTSPLRGHAIWLAVNRGEHSLNEAKALYVAEGFTAADIDALYAALYASFPLIAETEVMLHELKAAGYGIFAITDNVHEIVAQLKRDYDFFDQFEVAAVSAELGVLKPDPAIYRWLIDTAGIAPEESVFLDDVQRNVDGAKSVGMKAFVFTNAAKARGDLRSLGVDVAAASPSAGPSAGASAGATPAA